MGKVLKKVTKPFTKALGMVTGANATEAASKEQARQLDAQRQQEAQATLASVQASRDAAKSQQDGIESTIARDAANQKASDLQKSAMQGSDGTVDVEGAAAEDTDGEGRRVGTREKFMGRGASSSLRL